jgi:hypothetical protein
MRCKNCGQESGEYPLCGECYDLSIETDQYEGL